MSTAPTQLHAQTQTNTSRLKKKKKDLSQNSYWSCSEWGRGRASGSCSVTPPQPQNVPLFTDRALVEVKTNKQTNKQTNKLTNPLGRLERGNPDTGTHPERYLLSCEERGKIFICTPGRKELKTS